MARIDNDAFLAELANMYQRSKEHGSVYVTFKQVMRKKTTKKGKGEEEPVCLVRARLVDQKIRTEVRPRDVGRFQMNIGVVYRTEMDALQKRHKPKKTHLQ